MAGYKRGPHTNTHTPQHPSQQWRGAAATQAQAHRPRTAPPARRCRGPCGTSTQTHTHPNTSPVSGGAQQETDPKHTRRHRTSEPGTAEYRRSPHTATHARKPQPRMVRCRPKSKPNRKHRKPQPGKEGRNHNPYPNTRNQDPSQGWRGYRNPNPSTTRTQTQTPHKNRKPSVHSPGTEAARVMQMTRPNEIRSPGVRLHPKACPALGLEAERATPKRLGTPIPRTCMHALGTGYARKSGEPLVLPPKRGGVRKHGGTPSRRDKHVMLAAISPYGFFVHGGCPPASITQKGPNHGQVSVHGEPKFIEGQQPYAQ